MRISPCTPVSLAPGNVTPEGLGFHIRDSVLTGHAERIGHGVDIMHETESSGAFERDGAA